MVKLIFRIIGWIISITAILLVLYFLFADEGSGIAQLRELSSHGFFKGIRDFFVGMWNGFKHVVGL